MGDWQVQVWGQISLERSDCKPTVPGPVGVPILGVSVLGVPVLRVPLGVLILGVPALGMPVLRVPLALLSRRAALSQLLAVVELATGRGLLALPTGLPASSWGSLPSAEAFSHHLSPRHGAPGEWAGVCVAVDTTEPCSFH